MAMRGSARQAALAARSQPQAEISHPAMSVNLDACIQCTRCVRACREEQVNDVIGFAFRGAHSKIVFRPRRPDGRVDLRRVRRMRAGLSDRRARAGQGSYLARSTRRLPSVCPYCGVGCQLTYTWRRQRDRPVRRPRWPREPRAPVREGRFGFDYVAHPQRLTKPLIRKPASRDCRFRHGSGESARVVRERAGNEAGACRQHAHKIRDTHGGTALAGFGFGEGLERGGVSLPEARSHRLRLQQRRPLHAPLSCIECGRIVGGHWLGRRLQPGMDVMRRKSCC